MSEQDWNHLMFRYIPTPDPLLACRMVELIQVLKHNDFLSECEITTSHDMIQIKINNSKYIHIGLNSDYKTYHGRSVNEETSTTQKKQFELSTALDSVKQLYENVR